MFDVFVIQMSAQQVCAFGGGGPDYGAFCCIVRHCVCEL